VTTGFAHSLLRKRSAALTFDVKALNNNVASEARPLIGRAPDSSVSCLSGGSASQQVSDQGVELGVGDVKQGHRLGRAPDGLERR
jgi:hypothetical protein